MKHTILLIGPTKGRGAYDQMIRTEKMLRGLGYEVVNPWKVFAQNGDMGRELAERELVCVLMEVDMAVTVQGWMDDRFSRKIKQIADIMLIERCHITRLTQPGVDLADRARRKPFWKRLPNRSDAFLSGWMTNPNKAHRQTLRS